MLRRLLLLPLLLAADPADLAVQDRRALASAQGDVAAANARAEQLRRDADAAMGAAARAAAQQDATRATIEATEASLRAAEAQVAVVADAQRLQRARLAAHQQAIVRLLAAAESSARHPAALALVEPGSLDNAVHLRALLASAAPRVRAETEGLRKEIARGNALAADARNAVAAVRARQAALEVERTRLAALEIAERARSGSLLQSASIEEERAQGLGEEVRDLIDLQHRTVDQAELGRRLAALPGPVLRPSGPGEPGPAPLHPPVYHMPAAGALVTGFGEIAASGARARGLTLRTSGAAPVTAPLAGRIAYARPFRSYGGIVIIDHGGGWMSLVTGLARIDVVHGGSVAAGAPLGVTGGRRPSLTLELRRGGRPVDPAPFLVPRRG